MKIDKKFTLLIISGLICSIGRVKVPYSGLYSVPAMVVQGELIGFTYLSS